jgi:hypothetical protein
MLSEPLGQLIAKGAAIAQSVADGLKPRPAAPSVDSGFK